jgi:hypothetical protein
LSTLWSFTSFFFFFFLPFQISMFDLLSLIRWRVNGICLLINHQRPTVELRWWWWQGRRDISANNHHFKLESNIHAYAYTYTYIYYISIVKVNERVVLDILNSKSILITLYT